MLDIDFFFFCLSSLKNVGVSEKEHRRAFKVWKVFKIKNLNEYYDLYLKTDVLLLCDIFEKFIKVSLSNYGLDPCHYISSPGLSWDAMLKFTGVKLVKISNIDVVLSLGKVIRGGVSYLSKRYSKSDENTEIIYLDANNLNGWAMIQDLPYRSIKFLSEKEVNDFKLDSIPENSLIGYILDYPLAPEKIEISYNMLLKYSKDIADCYGIKIGGVKKLVPHLGNNLKYVSK